MGTNDHLHTEPRGFVPQHKMTRVVPVGANVTERFGDPKFYVLLEEIAELHSRKNHDYARSDEPLSNFRRAEAFGVEPWRGILIRMSDKWSRLEQLASGKTPKNESMRDTLIDNAVYSLLAILLLDESAR